MTPRADAEAMLGCGTPPSPSGANRGFGSSSISRRPTSTTATRRREDLYALVRYGATVTGSVASVVDLREPTGFDMASRQSVRKAEKSGVTVAEDDAWEEYWTMLGERLRSRYDARARTFARRDTAAQKPFSRQHPPLYRTPRRASARRRGGIHLTRCAHSQYTASSEEGARTARHPIDLQVYSRQSPPPGCSISTSALQTKTAAAR